jgi:hypothetical protein
MATLYELRSHISRECALWNPVFRILVLRIPQNIFTDGDDQFAVIAFPSTFWHLAQDMDQAARIVSDRRAHDPHWQTMAWPCPDLRMDEPKRIPRAAFDSDGDLRCDGCKQIIYCDMPFNQVFGEDAEAFIIFCDPCSVRFEAVAARWKEGRAR